MRRIAAAVVLVLGLGATVVVAAAPATAAPAAPAGTYVALPAAYRALDTQTGAGGNRKGALLHGANTRVSLTGHVPSSAIAALVSISVVRPSANGTLVAFKDGASAPGIASVTFPRSVTTTATVLAPLAGGRFRLQNTSTSGSTEVVGDLLGYYTGGTVIAQAPGVLNLESTPHRIVSARTTLAAGHSVTVSAGPVGVKSTVAVAISAIGPAGDGSISGYPYQTPPLTIGSVYYPKGYGATGLAFIRADTDGKVTFTNRGSTTTRIAVDLLGYSLRTAVPTAGAMQTLEPQRIVTAHSVGAGAVTSVPVAGRAGVALADTGSVAVAVTASSITRSGGLVIGAPGRTSTSTRNLSFLAGQTVGSTVIVPTSGGRIEIRNASSGALQVYVDVLGYLPSNTLAAPPTTTSHYLDGLTTGDNSSYMNQLGCDDAKSGATFVLLDIGAQSYASPLSSSSPGVSVALVTPAVRLTYAQLRSAVANYLSGYASTLCASADRGPATIALGTSNSGNFSDTTDTTNPPYAAATRGSDWYDDVVGPLRAESGPSVSVVGAVDIENGTPTGPDADFFDDVEANAQTWEAFYLKAAGPSATLIFNGAANGCPSSFGGTGACNDGWTLSQFVTLTRRLNTSGVNQIQVLPQVYYAQQAIQWANIDRTAGGKLTFAGVLTDNAVEPATFTADQGYTALYRALSSVVSVPSIPRSVGLTRTT